MKIKSLLIVVLLAGFSAGAGEYRDFKSADGKTIRGKVVRFDGKKSMVTIERDNKKKATVPVVVFSKEDQSYIKEWASMESFRSESSFRVSCDDEILEKWKEESSTQSIKYQKIAYDVMFDNRGSAAIKGLVAEYKIFYEQEKSVPGKNKKELHKKEKKGKLDVTRVESKEKTTYQTDPIQLEFFEFNASEYYYENGDPESTYGEVKGIWIRLTVKTESGEEVVRNIFEPASIKGKYSW